MAENKKNYFDKDAFKKAIAHVESSGGKYLENSTSSASGKYHFLYRYIQDIPLLKGVSRREFINSPELQETVMDMAIEGTLPGFPSYKEYAKELQSKYKTNLDLHDIAAITHFLGKTGAKNYLSNPSGFTVPGKNASVEQYVNKFRTAFDPEDNSNQSQSDKKKEPEELSLMPDYQESMANNPKAVEEKESNFKETTVENNQAYELNNEFEKVAENEVAPAGSEVINEENYLGAIQQLALGGYLNSHGAQDIIPIENGGTHEENIHGGVPMGVGANGKINTVEEGEVKFGDYVFSNRLSLGGKITQLGSKENIYADGGDLTNPNKKTNSTKDPVNPITDPVFNKVKTKDPLEFTKTEFQHNAYGGLDKIEEKFTVPDVRDQYMRDNYVTSEKRDDVNFNLAINDKTALEFLNRYNNPWSRQKLAEQAGLTNEDIDNMILKGLSPKKEIGIKESNSKASYDSDKNKINIGSEFNKTPGVETHERVHASLFDAAQGDNLMNVLGNPFDQEGREFMKKNSPDTVRYLKKPHEAYGNFVEFREKLGLKPGQQVTPEKVEELVKKKGLQMENFYRVYNTKNITKALNTIADSGSKPDDSEYRIA